MSPVPLPSPILLNVDVVKRGNHFIIDYFYFIIGAQSKPLNEMEGGGVPPPVSRIETAPPTVPPPPPLLSQMYPSYLHYSAPPAAFYFPAQSYPYTTDFVALPPPPNTPIGMPLGSLSFGSGYYSNTSSSTVPSKTGEPSVKKAPFIKGTSKKAPPELKKGQIKPTGGGQGHGGSVTSSMTSNSSHVMTCDLCSLTFPSLSVLNNHIKGSRHLRKVKSQQAYKQMKAAGMSIKQDGAGEIRCEVCRVSVNSSHQLQAHLAGN